MRWLGLGSRGGLRGTDLVGEGGWELLALQVGRLRHLMLLRAHGVVLLCRRGATEMLLLLKQTLMHGLLQ